MSLLSKAINYLVRLVKPSANTYFENQKPRLKAAVDKAIADTLIIGVENGEAAIPKLTEAILTQAKRLSLPSVAIFWLSTQLGAYLTDLVGKSGGAAANSLQNIGDKLKAAIDGARF